LNKTSVGRQGEKLGELYLIDKGHTILQKNYRKNFGEIDIISQLENTLYFIEVKTWISAISHPLESLTKKKCDKMRKLAKIFMYELGWIESSYNISFSLLYVRKDSIEFHTDLF